MKKIKKTRTIQATVIISALALLSSAILGCAQLIQSHIAQSRQEREQPFTYVLEQVDSEYAYQITHEGQQFEYPAPSSRLSVQSGALRAITVLSYNGSNYEEISILPVRRDWDECEYEIAVPPLAAPLIAERRVYDYYFLYMEPVSGTPSLDLVCNEIDLESGRVTAKIYRNADLLKLETLEPSPERKMLSDYEALLQEIQSLPALV